MRRESMKVLVTAAEAASLSDDFVIEDDSIPDRYYEYNLNEWDDYAIEEAVQFSEESEEDVEVVSVTIGPERSEETIRMALANGVDRAIRLWDSSLQDTTSMSTAIRVRLLRAVVDAEEPDVVLTGVQTADEGAAATGVSLAEEIGFEWAAVVNDLTLDGDSADVRRELENGVEEVTTVDLPAVLTIQTGINEPRYASLRGIRQAQRREIETPSLEELGVDLSEVPATSRVVARTKPDKDSDAVLFEGDTSDATAELTGVLREKGVVSR